MFEIKKINDDKYSIKFQIGDSTSIEKSINKKELKNLYSNIGIVLGRKLIPMEEV